MTDSNIFDNKLITVIMSFYNAEKYIKDSVESILDQTYKNIELIVMNDGSDDESQKILDRINDKRIKKHKNKINKGIPFCFNKLINYANGDYIAFMDADDISHKNRLKDQLIYIEKYNLDVCGTSAQTFGNNEKKVIRVLENYNDIKFIMIFGNPIINSSAMFKANILKNFKCNEKRISWDFDLYANLINNGYKIQNLQKILLYSRQHNHQDSKINFEKGIKDSFEISSDHFKQMYTIKNKNYFKNANLGYKKKIKYHEYLKFIIFLNYLVKKNNFNYLILELVNTNLIQKLDLSIKNYFDLIYINNKYKLKLAYKHKIFIFFKSIFQINYNGNIFKLLKFFNNLISLK
tara:strand:- start:1238 stop:2284 length:1047 start_codon:yes stop_codon:yes gene_type:complete